MPGYFYTAKCDCGYQQGLSPGFNPRTGESPCMAYNEHLTELRTIDRQKALAQGLSVIPDPALGEGKLLHEDVCEQHFGHYLCPSCKDPTLVLVKWGNWD